MYKIEKLGSTNALSLIATVVAGADAMGKKVSVAVAGPEGELIAFLRMDGANPTSSVIAQNKAYTAARDNQTTRAMGTWMRSSNTPPPFWGDPKITGFGGGVPILHDGSVVGAIGVSGLSEEEDEQLANAAIAAFAAI